VQGSNLDLATKDKDR